MNLFCPLPAKENAPREEAPIVTRIYITKSGDLVVTDLWKELDAKLNPGGNVGADDPSL